MGAMILNDVIVTLYSNSVKFDRDTYEALCRRLYDMYDTQTRTTSSFRFTNPRGGSCAVDQRHIRLTDFFAEHMPSVVVRQVAETAEALHAVFSDLRLETYDVQLSARLPQKELDQGSRINFLSSEEYLAARFLQDVDYGPLGATSPAVGLRFLWQADGGSYDLRVEPYFKDRTFIFLDLGIQYNEPPAAPRPLGDRLLADVSFLENNVVSFLRFGKAQATAPLSAPALAPKD